METAIQKGFDKNETLKAKGIAVSLLLFHHLYFSSSRIDTGGINLLLLDKEYLMLIARGARICVWIFAFLSAYGLTIQYNKIENPSMKDRWQFIKKRYFSLMKPFWFVFVLIFILSFFIFKNPIDIFEHSLLNGVLCFLGLSDLFGKPMLSSVWWYMCFAQVELLMIPFLVDICKKYGPIAVIASFIFMQFLNFEGVKSDSGGAIY